MNSRLKAINEGRKTFNSGRPCKNGHTGDRYTSTGGCIECLQGMREKIQQGIKQIKIDRNNAKAEGLTPYTVHIKARYNVAVSDYCHILRHGSPELIEQCQAFITTMKGTI